MEYKKSKQNAKRVISSAKEKKQKEWANDLNDSECQNEIFLRAKQMVKERQDITGLNCIKGAALKKMKTIRYDTRCYFNVRSKADISPLNLPHGTDN